MTLWLQADSLGGMERPPLRGRLEPGSAAPAEGERFTPLAELPGATVEQILSGALP